MPVRAVPAILPFLSTNHKGQTILFLWITLLLVGYFCLPHESDPHPLPNSLYVSSPNIALDSSPNIVAVPSSPVPTKRVLLPLPPVEHSKLKKIRSSVLVAVMPSLLNIGTGVFNASEGVLRRTAIRETWAAQVDTLFFVRALPEDTDQLTVSLKGDEVLIPQSQSIHNSAMYKYAMEYVADRYMSGNMPKFQYLMVVSDLSYVIPENLYKLLHDLDRTRPIFLGERLTIPHNKFQFISGSGYILSRPALSRLRYAWESSDEHCYAGAQAEKDNPDLLLAQCLKSLEIDAQNSLQRDGHLFNVYGPVTSVAGGTASWFKAYHENDHVLNAGASCCSARSVLFHFVNHQEARVLYSILHNQKIFRSMTQEERLQTWIDSTEDGINFERPSHESSVELWELLLTKIQISQ